MALTTLAKLKTHLGISGSAEDAFLTQLLEEVDIAVKSYIGWNPESATYTEFYDGPATSELPLKQTPVVLAGLRVWIDDNGCYGQPAGSFAAETELTVGSDFYLKLDGPAAAYSLSGLLVRVGRPWSRRSYRAGGRLAAYTGPGEGNVKVTYTGGYSTIPKDLELAVHQVAARARLGRSFGASPESESYEGYSYNLAGQVKTAMSAGDAVVTLARYRRLVL